MGSNSPDSATLYYDDGTISVSGKMIIVGTPYNQTYNFGSIVGTAYGKDNSGQLVSLMWIILSVFGLLFGLTAWTNHKVLGATIIVGSATILVKMIQRLDRPYVELKFGGLNNQMLYMKGIEQAQHLAAAINMAMQDMHTPPEPGQPVKHAPIFPDPVISRN